MAQENEIWKKVSELPTMEEFREGYKISNFGRLKLLDGKISKTKPNTYGYIHPTLTTNEGKWKHILLHRLVALAFCGGFEEGLVVNHIDENKTNNHFENLEWITAKENVNHGTCIERREKPVEAITDGVVFTFKSTQHAAEFGFTQSAVSRACREVYGKHCSHGGTSKYKGYVWRFA